MIFKQEYKNWSFTYSTYDGGNDANVVDFFLYKLQGWAFAHFENEQSLFRSF